MDRVHIIWAHDDPYRPTGMHTLCGALPCMIHIEMFWPRRNFGRGRAPGNRQRDDDKEPSKQEYQQMKVRTGPVKRS